MPLVGLNGSRLLHSPLMGALAMWSLVASGSGSASSISIGSLLGFRHKNGDLIVIWHVGYDADGTAPSTETPADFTNHQNTSANLGANSARAIISSKIWDGINDNVNVMAGSSSQRNIIACFRPAFAIASRTWNSGNGQVTTGNPTSQTIAASGGGAPLLAVGHMWSSGTVDPRTTSPTMNEIAGSSVNHYAHWLQYQAAESPANISYDMDDEGNNAMQSGYFTFA